MPKIKPPEITPEHLYLSRRRFIKSTGAAVVSAAFLSACERAGLTGKINKGPTRSPLSGKNADDLGNRLTSFYDITHYNNFYEFTTDKEEVAALAKDFKTSPWAVKVGGLVKNPKTYDVEDLVRRLKPGERIYRHRCVEGWSMVIPWIGFSLAALLKEAQPEARAKFVCFTSVLDPKQMPGQRSDGFVWPYVEGLRLDEAMNELSTLATGLYGRQLRPQNGAPLRLVIPWKYGFKGIKSIVKIDLVEKMPISLWMAAAPDEYGFYSNVNPAVDHPRWSQSSERRIGKLGRVATLPFNGYGKEVAYLYKGMDLKKNF